MSEHPPALDLVTGAFSYSGAHIAQRLLDNGRRVRTLTFHPEREHSLSDEVEALPFRFDDVVALARSLEGVDTLYNTYWVRFDHGNASFSGAIANSSALFHAALRAGVRRIVHLSIANPSVDSPLSYYRGKALVENALAEVGLPFAIVRPTWIFGGQPEILANNIAWILRHMPIFAVPGDGSYPVQPVHIDDLVEICIDAGNAQSDLIVDAAGPEVLPFRELVHSVRAATGSRSPILHVPATAFYAGARALGLLVKDVVLTSEEITALMDGLLVSQQPGQGKTAFTTWVTEHELGRTYANELNRHFKLAAPT
jgi:NADH dehydrogenase